MQQQKDDDDNSWIDKEMEGEVAGYWMKKDEVKNSFSRPTRASLGGRSEDNRVDKAAYKQAARAMLGKMSRKQHLESCYLL